jgi:hypothetical protein
VYVLLSAFDPDGFFMLELLGSNSLQLDSIDDGVDRNSSEQSVKCC